MDTAPKNSSLFDVFLRLRPAPSKANERFLDVEPTEADCKPTHITIKPPSNDHRKRAVEKFAFTRVFEEYAQQLDIFEGIKARHLIEGVVGVDGQPGRDGLLATLGTGQSHTILGSKSQRGLTQLSLEVLFRSLSSHLVHPHSASAVFPSLCASDISDAQLLPANVFLENLFGDGQSERGRVSRAQTPLPERFKRGFVQSGQLHTRLQSAIDPPTTIRPVCVATNTIPTSQVTKSAHQLNNSPSKDSTSFLSLPPTQSRRIQIPRLSTLPQSPALPENAGVPADGNAEYSIIISMYEVYNDRIFDLLSGSAVNGPPASLSYKTGGTLKERRRALLFKPTEMSPDRKVVAGLRKLVCSTLDEALMVLETGLLERKVAGTGSNAASSRSHGFFCVEVKKRDRIAKGRWEGSTMTIVDLAGSERARQAKTAGATLAEAGKINESLMYLGQCMQLQSDNQDGSKNIVPFRQCKLTELLFSNSFPSAQHQMSQSRTPQKSIMIVTADPMGDFNATSQILRYSALAREVTVPRIPSLTSQILSGNANLPSSRMDHSNNQNPANGMLAEELESSREDIARLSEQLEVLSVHLTKETSRRRAAEASWKAMEERMQSVEQNIRDEMLEEMEVRVEAERRRWKGAWDEEADRYDEHMDRKLEILAQGIKIYEDPEPGTVDQVQELEDENASLRRKIQDLEREMGARTPSKKQRVLKSRKWEVDVNLESP
ncbi:P-loop containing nucleoside triphosphate hydrolase protein [Eremomyces bilateralis CBS 781.70]|uniref:Kinesin-like protein n=1 Tax=Eremomyces bilateralis CBS 781.70 TaxID=1392243 RepID=A0A6G1G505_9PEZI|nr:P-loop containing nucleoside triphosphate hydrolase protein [Eremomyces bilateralis CBS 781.70]KAF1812990.1 P-loop containing nucleoside triphosphate hydrolase protein [Eremomyces bilateralis CBS 781.70]